MRIALDHEPLSLTSGGLTRYVEELTAALKSEYPDDEYLYLPAPRNFFERRWWLYGAARATAETRAEIFHGTNFAIPYLTSRPTVLTLHDLSPWRNRGWHGSPAAARIRRRTPLMIRRASHVITPSEAVRTEAIRHFRISPDRITAVPLAASALFHPVPQPSEPYFLFVGTLEPRKGLSMLLEAWRATGRTVPLRIAGRLREDFPPLEPEPNLHLLGEVPDADLPALYTNATAVIYPSEYEGFGLPVLEAMQCGANVITSRDPALAELGGDATQKFQTAHDLVQLLCSPDPWSADRRARALARSQRYSWPETARQTHAVYEAVTGGAHRWSARRSAVAQASKAVTRQ